MDLMDSGSTISLKKPEESLRDRKFWQWLSPNLHIADQAFCSAISPFGIGDPTGQVFDQRIVEEGYFQYFIQPENWQISLGDMAETVKALVKRGLAPPLAFLYDEFWLLFAKQSQIIARYLGPDYLMLPDFWVWHVDPTQGQNGWRPHRDKGRHALFPDGKPKSLTIWVPLTLATPTNSCMYLVPANKDRNYGTEKEKDWQFDYADVRALPGQPGNVFIWNQAVLHWGSATSRFSPDGPRVSVAFEFQRRDVEPFNRPLMSPNTLPSFEDRLKLVAKQILQYQHMYPLSPDLAEFAKGLLQ
jgi:hypothetical protein